MATISSENVESTILARVIDLESPTFPVAVATEVLKWKFSEADQGRMQELAAKARAGSLDNHEAEEADAYGRVSSFLGMMKSKARRSLKSQAPSNDVGE